MLIADRPVACDDRLILTVRCVKRFVVKKSSWGSTVIMTLEPKIDSFETELNIDYELCLSLSLIFRKRGGITLYKLRRL